MEITKDIFKYNTKNAGQQLISLSNDYYKHIDEVSKADILESMRSIGVELIKQYEERKDKFNKPPKENRPQGSFRNG